MAMVTGLVYSMLLACLSLTTQIHGQEDKSGFISIDCGMPEGHVYENTYYSSDDTFVNTGINRNISAEYKEENRLLDNLRSFPQGKRTCYTLTPEQGKYNTYLIRVWFWYGNYDGLKNPPKFDLYIGVNLWEELDLSNDTTAKMSEIMYVASTDCIHVCLLDKGEGTPFISALELRHLNGPIYKSETRCLAYYERNFMGSSRENWILDDLGRSWSHKAVNDSKNISTSLTINPESSKEYQLPSSMMRIGVEALNASKISLQYSLDVGGDDSKFYVYLHFCDVEETGNDELREFNILLNDDPWPEPVRPSYLTTTTVPVNFSSRGEIRLSLVRTIRSTLPPILNAVEIYVEKKLPRSDSCERMKKKKNRNTIAIIVASVVPSIILLRSIAILWSLKRRRRTEGRTLKPKNRRFTYSEVVTITNNFERVIGKGGFGTVYLGYLEDGTEVAVKMFSRPLSQGSEQFWTEAELLTTVHHRNVASLIGYCDQGSNTALLYEYMGNGNLKECLLDQNRAVLTWKQRLQIAIDAAHALEYLHNGCKPPIIHRDIKTTNILLTENLQAKVADFGLSRIFPAEDGSHVSTEVVGTFGYLDPEYYYTKRLTEKSDVYSFGVVLLELITGQPAVIKSEENVDHIVQWVMPMLERGEISSIADPRLQGDFESNSVWKALETAIACIPSSAVQRLSMSQVLGELNECLQIYLASEGPLEISEGSNSGIDYSRNPLDLESSMSGP
ncbi:putative leucine-rich repeat receptor-like serine/threonine-protein kinase At2g19230 isoform X2 [Rhododendron vialii]|nr:putative leucine-rich repeat receptor-like serine/threonine-protein kinase At2g19230 isoform X2 [Rhododendron vialii]